MTLVSLIKPALLATLVVCAACGSAEGPSDEAIGEAPASANAKLPGYGYEMVPDQTDAVPEPNPRSEVSEASEVSEIPAGRLTPQVIQSTVRARFPEMRACNEAALQQAPALSGKVEARFVIQQDGSVTGVQDSGSTLNDPAMIQCVLGVFGGTTFPASGGGASTVVYPVEFTPDN